MLIALAMAPLAAFAPHHFRPLIFTQRAGVVASASELTPHHFRPLIFTQRAGVVASASLLTWSDLESRVPSSVDPMRPAVYDAEKVSAADLEGKLVLFRDANGWCPYAQRVWLALEIKQAEYVTCLVHHSTPADYSAPIEKGSLPRVQWPDGSTEDGSSIGAILERIEQDYPQPPAFFPKASVSVGLVRDSFNRFEGIMPRFTLPSSLLPYVFACKIQRAGSFKIEECELGEVRALQNLYLCLYLPSRANPLPFPNHSAVRESIVMRDLDPNLIFLTWCMSQLVPKFKYDVCLEEIDEVLGEYEDGPFIAGRLPHLSSHSHHPSSHVYPCSSYVHPPSHIPSSCNPPRCRSFWCQVSNSPPPTSGGLPSLSGSPPFCRFSMPRWRHGPPRGRVVSRR